MRHRLVAGLAPGTWTPRRVWLTAFLAFFALSAAWSLATPLTAAPDESFHMVKAAATVRGQLHGSPTGRGHAQPDRHQPRPDDRLPPADRLRRPGQPARVLRRPERRAGLLRPVADRAARRHRGRHHRRSQQPAVLPGRRLAEPAVRRPGRDVRHAPGLGRAERGDAGQRDGHGLRLDPPAPLPDGRGPGRRDADGPVPQRLGEPELAGGQLGHPAVGRDPQPADRSPPRAGAPSAGPGRRGDHRAGVGPATGPGMGPGHRRLRGPGRPQRQRCAPYWRGPRCGCGPPWSAWWAWARSPGPPASTFWAPARPPPPTRT